MSVACKPKQKKKKTNKKKKNKSKKSKKKTKKKTTTHNWKFLIRTINNSFGDNP